MIHSSGSRQQCRVQDRDEEAEGRRAGGGDRVGEPESRAFGPETKASRANRSRRPVGAEEEGEPLVEGFGPEATSTADGGSGQPWMSEASGVVEPACRGDGPENGLTRRSLLRRVRSCSSQRVTPDDRSAVDHPTRAALGGAPSPPTAAQPRALNVFRLRICAARSLAASADLSLRRCAITTTRVGTIAHRCPLEPPSNRPPDRPVIAPLQPPAFRRRVRSSPCSGRPCRWRRRCRPRRSPS